VDNITYPEVKPDWKLRRELEQKGITELIHELEKLDPRRAENIDAKNKVRLIRAIEICKTLGQVPPLTSYRLPVTDYNFLQIGVSVPKEKLHAKIKKRLDDRWRDGMIKEVERLHQEGLSYKKIQAFGLGYFWIPEYLNKRITLEELYEKVYSSEKDYAKRQMTWFAKDKRILWLEKYQDMKKELEKFIGN
jgi:tRNA dimethylallyltransferase